MTIVECLVLKCGSLGHHVETRVMQTPSDRIHSVKAGIPPGKSNASDGIGPKHIVTSTSGFSARCRPMRPIFLVEFQLKVEWGQGRLNVFIVR